MNKKRKKTFITSMMSCVVTIAGGPKIKPLTFVHIFTKY